MRGQLKKGVEKTPSILKPYIKCNKSNKIYSSVITNNLYTDLHNLYKINRKIKGPRINIGGDHSMSIATVAHSLNKVYNLKVIWIDAHADINTSFSSLTNNYHGMPLSFLTGLDRDDRFSFIKNTLKFKNLLYIGIRNLDDFELKVIDKCNIKYITCDEINKNPYISLLKIRQFLNNQSFHLSFDVDSLDPSIITSTGTIAKNGLLLENTKFILQYLMASKNMINMDITELNIELGNNKKSLNNLLDLIDFN
jgi:arginase